MSKWIEEAIQKGLTAAQVNAKRQKLQEARVAFRNEVVDQVAVQTFLDPLAQAIEDVISELGEHQYTVIDKGYGFGEVYDPNSYALTHQREDNGHVAYGRIWEIDAPSGDHMDTLYLFPLVSESTHFARGHFSLGSGWGSDTNPDELWNLRRMIGARITQYIEDSKR